jgi:hypothetical protein
MFENIPLDMFNEIFEYITISNDIKSVLLLSKDINHKMEGTVKCINNKINTNLKFINKFPNLKYLNIESVINMDVLDKYPKLLKSGIINLGIATPERFSNYMYNIKNYFIGNDYNLRVVYKNNNKIEGYIINGGKYYIIGTTTDISQEIVLPILIKYNMDTSDEIKNMIICIINIIESFNTEMMTEELSESDKILIKMQIDKLLSDITIEKIQQMNNKQLSNIKSLWTGIYNRLFTIERAHLYKF